MKNTVCLRIAALSTLALLMSSCGRPEQTLLDQAQSMMDQRDYVKAIQVLEEGNAEHGSNEAKIKLGYAYLGAAGVEFSDLAQNLNSLEKLDLKKFSFSTLPMIHLEHVPSPEDAHLIRAFEIFDQAFPETKQAPQEVNLLLAAVEFSLAIEYYDRLVNIHSGTDLTRATLTIINVKRSLSSLLNGMHHLYYSYGKIKRFLKKAEAKPLFRVGNFSYNLSEKITMTNFFDFLTQSSEVELKDDIDSRASDPRGAATFLSKLSQNLNWFRTHTSLDQAAVSHASNELIQISSRIAPKQINLKPAFDRPAEPVHISTNDLPQFLQRMVGAVKVAWNTENAQALFDERAHELQVLDELQTLGSKWESVPKSIQETIPAGLLSETSEKLKWAEPLEIDPTDPSSIRRIAEYYDILDDSINEWLKSLDQSGNRVNLSLDFQGLLKETATWMDANVTPHPKLNRPY